jgi:hypothetical protein
MYVDDQARTKMRNEFARFSVRENLNSTYFRFLRILAGVRLCPILYVTSVSTTILRTTVTDQSPTVG